MNPDDFLRRDFIDTNGDVAMDVFPLLLLGLTLPIDTSVQCALALFFAVVGITGLPTNQLHQWAHMSNSPFWVKKLQDFGIILSRPSHSRRHRSPYNIHYCIAFGWCNGISNSTDFFARLERIVTRLTGLHPREDDFEFAISVEDPVRAEIMYSGRREE